MNDLRTADTLPLMIDHYGQPAVGPDPWPLLPWWAPLAALGGALTFIGGCVAGTITALEMVLR